MIIWMIGIISICLGTLEQFLVNESRIMAGVILAAGIILLIGIKVKNTKLPKWQMYSIFGIAGIHIIGLISDRWVVYSGLGIITTLMGIILIVWSLIKIKSKKVSDLFSKSAFL